MRPIEQIVDQQLRRWSLDAGSGRARPWVTISRGFGSGGNEIAHGLAERLRYRLFDKDVLELMAGRAQIRDAVLRTLDEKTRRSIQRRVRESLQASTMAKTDYLGALMEVVLVVGHHGDAVLLGRGANFILDPAGGLSVRVVAPFDHQVEVLMKRFSLSPKEARRRVEAAGREQERFVKSNFRRDGSDPANYDLVINSARMELEAAVGALEAALREKLRLPDVRAPE
jgi:cytidylate kinase